jgi:hypothetical protein
MERPILVDTDVMVEFLRGNPHAEALIRKHSTRILVSPIVAAELYAGVKGADELNRLDDLLSLFPIAAVSREIARAGGLYKRDYAKSHGVGLADALVAATADAHDADLKTLNVRHYPMVKGLKAAYKKP